MIYSSASLSYQNMHFSRWKLRIENFALSARHDSAQPRLVYRLVIPGSAQLRDFDLHPGRRPKRHSKPAHLQPRHEDSQSNVRS